MSPHPQEAEDNWDKALSQSKCVKENDALLECKNVHGDWRKCTAQMAAFKECWKNKQQKHVSTAFQHLENVSGCCLLPTSMDGRLTRSFTDTEQSLFKPEDDAFYDEPLLCSNPFRKDHFREHMVLHFCAYAALLSLLVLVIAVPSSLVKSRNARGVPMEALLQAVPSPAELSVPVGTMTTDVLTVTVPAATSQAVTTASIATPEAITSLQPTVTIAAVEAIATVDVVSTVFATTIVTVEVNALPTLDTVTTVIITQQAAHKSDSPKSVAARATPTVHARPTAQTIATSKVVIHHTTATSHPQATKVHQASTKTAIAKPTHTPQSAAQAQSADLISADAEAQKVKAQAAKAHTTKILAKAVQTSKPVVTTKASIDKSTPADANAKDLAATTKKQREQRKSAWQVL